MPDFAFCDVTIEGGKPSILWFRKSLNKPNAENKPVLFSFNQLVPVQENEKQPKELIDIAYPRKERIDKWGTKWDAQCPKLVGASDNVVKLSFQSAWCPPVEWAENVTKAAKEEKKRLKITIDWEILGVEGISVIAGGKERIKKEKAVAMDI